MAPSMPAALGCAALSQRQAFRSRGQLAFLLHRDCVALLVKVDFVPVDFHVNLWHTEIEKIPCLVLSPPPSTRSSAFEFSATADYGSDMVSLAMGDGRRAMGVGESNLTD